ncbi:MAG: glycoside hydrolase family 5 protein [Clostridiales bacterium]|jgi:endoglucanase|nr:glycoside hydrolase family 5 protein [Clostridiales bacterium]
MKKKRRGLIVFIALAVLSVTAVVTGLSIIFGFSAANEKRDGTVGFEFVERLGAGINLGNALEAFGDPLDGSYETSWGNAALTEEVIQKVADAGFSSVRLPITWVLRTGVAPDYLISPTFLARVKEVTDWILAADMIAVINMHHDDYYWFIPNPAHEEATARQYKAMWTQIAVFFKDYGENLVFEAFNEPRVVGSVGEWSGGSVFTRNVLNRLNRVFVDTVRASGGNNANRFLFLPDYGGAVDANAVKGLEVPTGDTRLIVAVHLYKPRDFATDHNMSAATFTEKDKKAVDKIFKLLKDTFISKGIPVVIDEFGAHAKNNEAERAAYAAYVTARAKAEKTAAFWWDNGVNTTAFTDDAYGILDRATGEFKYPLIVKALTGKDL